RRCLLAILRCSGVAVPRATYWARTRRAWGRWLRDAGRNRRVATTKTIVAVSRGPLIRRVLHASAYVAVLTSTLAACAGLSAGAKTSDGIYRIPYGDGTHIRVSNDHRTHDPPNRLDIIGLGAPPYRIVAAAGGVVRYIVDEFDTRQDLKTARQCN